MIVITGVLMSNPDSMRSCLVSRVFGLSGSAGRASRSFLDRLRPDAAGPREHLITFVRDWPGHDFRYTMGYAGHRLGVAAEGHKIRQVRLPRRARHDAAALRAVGPPASAARHGAAPTWDRRKIAAALPPPHRRGGRRGRRGCAARPAAPSGRSCAECGGGAGGGAERQPGAISPLVADWRGLRYGTGADRWLAGGRLRRRLRQQRQAIAPGLGQAQRADCYCA